MKKQSSRRSQESTDIARNLMLAPMVMWMRTPLLAGEMSQDPASRTESMRAVSEKVDAAREGAIAAQLSYFQSLASFWPEVISGQPPSVFSGVAAERMVNAALKPSSRRVESNFKRLTKKP